MRIAAALIVALLLSLFVIRNAFVAAFASSEPARAAAIWPGHPRSTLESGLAEVGTVAARGEKIDRGLVDRLINAFRKAPLAPEPFLVRGVQAQMAGDEALAGRSFLAARDRDPRGIGARYFLADHYLRVENVEAGLAEISGLIRLVPQSLPSTVPYLAAYARRPDSAAKVKAMIRRQPRLEAELLNQLAADSRNLELVLYLWSGGSGADSRAWQARLLNELVKAGRYHEARSAWTRFTGISPTPDQLFDRDFAVADRPPFGWTLVSGSAGVTEPQGGGRLHIIYYGRDDLVLASQLLTLNPGRFRLSMKRSGPDKAGQSLTWIVRCLPSSTEIASISLGQPAKSGAVAGSFVVPVAGCGAQQLELTAKAPEIPEQAELTISQISLERERGA